MFGMPLKIWIDGKFHEKDSAKISVYDHGVLYGDGVFEGIRVYKGKIFECEAHLRRLMDSARAIRLAMPRTPEQLKAAPPKGCRRAGPPRSWPQPFYTRPGTCLAAAGLNSLGHQPQT